MKSKIMEGKINGKIMEKKMKGKITEKIKESITI